VNLRKYQNIKEDRRFMGDLSVTFLLFQVKTMFQKSVNKIKPQSPKQNIK
jgi:hypothetical protein